jgi:hypothetical protein
MTSRRCSWRAAMARDNRPIVELLSVAVPTSLSRSAASCSGMLASARVAMRASRGVYVPSIIPSRRSSGTATRPRPDC